MSAKRGCLPSSRSSRLSASLWLTSVRHVSSAPKSLEDKSEDVCVALPWLCRCSWPLTAVRPAGLSE